MPSRRTAAAPATEALATPPVAQSTSAFIKLTRVIGEQQNPVTYGDGEDDAETTTEPGPSEITSPLFVRPTQLRYYFGRRDGRPGAELWFVNGNIQVVSDTLETLDGMLPAFVKLASSGAPGDGLTRVNGEVVRFFHPSSEGQGTRLTFPNGNKLDVTPGIDEVAQALGAAPGNWAN